MEMFEKAENKQERRGVMALLEEKFILRLSVGIESSPPEKCKKEASENKNEKLSRGRRKRKRPQWRSSGGGQREKVPGLKWTGTNWRFVKSEGKFCFPESFAAFPRLSSARRCPLFFKSAFSTKGWPHFKFKVHCSLFKWMMALYLLYFMCRVFF